jgi:hypothetical protein
VESGVAQKKEGDEERTAERGEEEFTVRSNEESRTGGEVRPADIVRDCIKQEETCLMSWRVRSR